MIFVLLAADFSFGAAIVGVIIRRSRSWRCWRSHRARRIPAIIKACAAEVAASLGISIATRARRRSRMTTLELYGHVIRRMRPHLGRLAIAIAGVLLAAATEVLKPWPLKIVIDNVLRGAPLVSSLDSADAARRAAHRRVRQPRHPVRAARPAQRRDQLRHHLDRPADGQRVARAPVRSSAAPLALVPSPPRSRRPDGAHHLRHLLDPDHRDERIFSRCCRR